MIKTASDIADIVLMKLAENLEVDPALVAALGTGAVGGVGLGAMANRMPRPSEGGRTLSGRVRSNHQKILKQGDPYVARDFKAMAGKINKTRMRGNLGKGALVGTAIGALTYGANRMGLLG